MEKPHTIHASLLKSINQAMSAPENWERFKVLQCAGELHTCYVLHLNALKIGLPAAEGTVVGRSHEFLLCMVFGQNSMV